VFKKPVKNQLFRTVAASLGIYVNFNQ